jgi:hypothetical protein
MEPYYSDRYEKAVSIRRWLMERLILLKPSVFAVSSIIGMD